MPDIKVCNYCGVQLSRNTRSKYCNMACYRKAQRSGAYKWDSKDTKIYHNYCSNCGKHVNRSKNPNRDGGICEHIFCGVNCNIEYKRKLRYSMNKKCKQCGRLIEDTMVFCNDTCSKTYKQAKSRICKQCGKSFIPIYINLDGNIKHLNDRVFCSNNCLHEFYRTDQKRKDKISVAMTGEKHPAWLGGRVGYRGVDWRGSRRKCIERDTVCQDCGMTQEKSLSVYGSLLEVHHIRPARLFENVNDSNTMDNLVLLCKSCHKQVEWQTIKDLGLFTNQGRNQYNRGYYEGKVYTNIGA